MFLKRGIMRYYRVWIYSCNLALFAATIIFITLFIWLLTDIHLSLFTSINFYQPSFIYGFVALVLQGGVLQAIGCLGAVRMNEKLLTLYYHILVVLLFGDAIVGVIWLFRYNYLVTNLRSDLKSKLNNDYGYDASFQELWDRIQSESKCCGIDSPFDYNSTKWLEDKHEESPSQLVPRSCCRSDPVTHLTHRSHNPLSLSSSILYHHYQKHHHHYHPHHRHERSSSIDSSCVETYSPDSINVYGCHDSILKWFQRTIETLSVLGFCVITFLKLCFAFILRYEIKEMIQKIQMLKGEGAMSGCVPAAPLHELEAYLPRASIQQETGFETTQLVSSSNQCPSLQSPPSSSVATSTAAQSTADTQRHRLNSRVEQVRTSSSTVTTTAILNLSTAAANTPSTSNLKSPPSTSNNNGNTPASTSNLKSPPSTSNNNGNNNEMTFATSSTRSNRTVKPSPV